jgi:hypothetical protein
MIRVNGIDTMADFFPLCRYCKHNNNFKTYCKKGIRIMESVITESGQKVLRTGVGDFCEEGEPDLVEFV